MAAEGGYCDLGSQIALARVAGKQRRIMTGDNVIAASRLLVR